MTAKYSYEPYPIQAGEDLDTIRENTKERQRQRFERLRLACVKGIGATAIGMTMAGTYLQRDIAAGKEAVADSHSSLHFVYDSDNRKNDDVATIVATGLGTRDPSATAKLLKSHQQIGSVYALEYSNKDINIDELTQTVVTMAREKGVTSLVFDGYSAGGPIELAIAANIHEHEPDLQVSAIILGSSPIGDQGITEKSKEAADTLSAVLNVYPDLVYSEKLRGVVEVIARRKHYLNVHGLDIDFDFDQLVDQARDVYEDKLSNPDAASGALIKAQYEFIQSYGVERSLEILSKPFFDKPSPYLYYTRAANADDDTVVNVIRSEQNLVKMTHHYGLDVQSFPIQNAGHANPGERPTEYNQTYAFKIQPKIEQQIADQQLFAAGE